MGEPFFDKYRPYVNHYKCMPTIVANTRTPQLFCGDDEHRLVTLALVKEVVNSVHLKNQNSAGLVEAALLNLRLVRSTATHISLLCG